MVIATLLVYVLLDFVGNIRNCCLELRRRSFEFTSTRSADHLPGDACQLLLAVVGTVGELARHLEITSMKMPALCVENQQPDYSLRVLFRF